MTDKLDKKVKNDSKSEEYQVKSRRSVQIPKICMKKSI